MCGRFKLSTPEAELRAALGFVEQPNLAPRYNIAPTQEVPVLRQRREPKGERTLQNLRWGLIPSWAKDAQDRLLADQCARRNPGGEAGLRAPRSASAAAWCRPTVSTNGRARARASGPISYRAATARAFAFAGLWERWTPKAGGKDSPAIDSFTIITTEANALLRPLHPRMPVILPADALRGLARSRCAGRRPEASARAGG